MNKKVFLSGISFFFLIIFFSAGTSVCHAERVVVCKCNSGITETIRPTGVNADKSAVTICSVECHSEKGGYVVSDSGAPSKERTAVCSCKNGNKHSVILAEGDNIETVCNVDCYFDGGVAGSGSGADVAVSNKTTSGGTVDSSSLDPGVTATYTDSAGVQRTTTTTPTDSAATPAVSPSNGNGLIVCGNPGQDPCRLCHVIYVINYVMKWLFRLMFIIGTVMIFISGVMYIVAGADSGLATKAKGYIKNTLLGVVVIVCAWLIVNTAIWVLGANTNLGSMTGTWYNANISCP